MNVESELKSIINRLYDIQDVSGPDLSKKIYEIILQCREAIGYRKAELDRVQSSRKPIKNNFVEKHGIYHNDTWKLEVVELEGNTAILKPVKSDDYFVVKNPEIDEEGDLVWTSDSLPMTDYDTALKNFNYHKDLKGKEVKSSRKPIKSDYHDKEIYRQAFGSLLEDYAPEGDFPGGYRVLVDGNYETEFSANSREEAIQKFKDYFANKKKGINNSKKPIKSFRDTSVEDTSNDYGFHWDGDNIYDKDGFHWYFGDYTKDNTGIEPYSSYIQAVKETTDSIRDSFTEDEIPDPEDYAYQLIDFAVETLPDPGKFIKEYEGF